MICDPCKYAGQQNRLNNMPGSADLSKLIKADHSKCEHPDTCPCQHFIGQVIRPELR